MAAKKISVTLSSIGKFHHFDLARQLSERSMLAGIYTGYPLWRLKNERFDSGKIISFPYVYTLYMAYNRAPILGTASLRALETLASFAHDSYVASRLKPCDVFVGLSGHNTKAGQRAQTIGARWVCDRGSTHILHQNKVLSEECGKWGISFSGASCYTIAHELEEYVKCDYITVPSRFVERTFIDYGVPPRKLRRIPYGVELKAFHPVAEPASDSFDVIFVGQVSVRKGVPYLIEAFRNLKHPKKTLTIIGLVNPGLGQWLGRVEDENIRFLGHVPQPELKQYLSRSHVFVLPSIEEGLALVQAQALACGCPVICTPNTGGADIFEDGRSGFIVPVCNAAAITEKLEHLAGDLGLQTRMRAEAIQVVKKMGGWSAYGNRWAVLLNEITGMPSKK